MYVQNGRNDVNLWNVCPFVSGVVSVLNRRSTFGLDVYEVMHACGQNAYYNGR